MEYASSSLFLIFNFYHKYLLQMGDNVLLVGDIKTALHAKSYTRNCYSMPTPQNRWLGNRNMFTIGLSLTCSKTLSKVGHMFACAGWTSLQPCKDWMGTSNTMPCVKMCHTLCKFRILATTICYNVVVSDISFPYICQFFK